MKHRLPMIGAFLLSLSPLLAAEPPGAWFLNAHGTGSEPYVYFSVGGTAKEPPEDARSVVLGWSWNEGKTPVERYPGRHPVEYRSPDVRDKRARQWRDKGRKIGLPPVAIGPGRELLFLGDDTASTAEAARWAELLDVVEAAYRHSAPKLADGERRGELVIGQIGPCTILSRPVDGDAPGWGTLSLPGHALPSRIGGFYYVGKSPSRLEDRGTVEVQRFLRWVDARRPEDCAGRDNDLRLFTVPKGYGKPEFAYFVIWKSLDVSSPGLLDLAAVPRYPSVRRRAQGPARKGVETINLADWPVHDGGSPDLCRSGFLGEACAADLGIRSRLVTSIGAGSLPPVLQACRKTLAKLGVSGDPCSDPELWSLRATGIYRSGYRGELPLGPELSSVVNEAGAVEWRWHGKAPKAPRRIELADGRRIELGLPPREPRSAAAFPEPGTSEPGTVAEVPADRPAGNGSTDNTPREPSATSDRSDRSDTPGMPLPQRIPSVSQLQAWLVQSQWRDPKLMFGVPAAALAFFGLVFFLRRSSVSPRARTSFVLRVPSSDEGAATAAPIPEPAQEAVEPASVADLPLSNGSSAAQAGDLPLGFLSAIDQRALAVSAPQEEAPAAEEAVPVTVVERAPRVPAPPPARPRVETAAEPEAVSETVRETVPETVQEIVPETVPPEPIPDEVEAPASPLEPLRVELDALAAPESRSLRRTLDATCRLAAWIRSALPVLREIEEGHGLARFESLPLPARREWIDAYDTLRQFVDVDAPVFEELSQGDAALAESPARIDAVERYLATAGLMAGDRPLRERLRRHLLAHDPPGRVHGVVLALQYLLEAFPVEHLEIYERKAYRAALREQLLKSGVPPQLHKVIGELADGLGLRYQEVRYYKTEIAQPGFEFLENAHDRISLSARVGYDAETDCPSVVRLSEIFLFEASSGAYYSGRAAMDEGAVAS